MSPRRLALLLALCLAAGAGLRGVGVDRARAIADAGVTAVRTFHPDEDMVVEAVRAGVDPLAPPFTVYGLLPLYALGALLAALPATPTDADVYLAARCLAAAFSCLILWLTWRLGRRHAGAGAACLATFFVAFAPGAIQQAHFYIVDGLFGLLSLATLAAILRAGPGERRARFLAVGAGIGATAAVKLTGLLLGGVLFATLVHAALARGDRAVAAVRRALATPGLWWAAAASVATLVGLEPYLLTDPGAVGRTGQIGDFGASAAVADGTVLRPWTLADVHTTPYLRHALDLVPLIVGWPLALLAAAGIGLAAWRRSRLDVAILAWGVLYFGLVGGLHAKHVRYLIPLVPLLALLAAQAAGRAWGARGRGRWPARAAVAAVALYTAAYGVAFARIYTVPDARLQALRWVEVNVPPGSVVTVEVGGFSMAPLLPAERYGLQPMREIRGFAARGYLTCGAVGELLHEQLAPAAFAALVEENRYRQFTAVPDLLPASARFYRDLLAGRMGFAAAATFHVPVSLGGFAFEPAQPEVSFVAYDHPTVHVLRREPGFEAAWAEGWAALRAEAACPDGDLAAAAASAAAGDLETAAARLATARRDHPDTPLVDFVAAWVEARTGRPDSAAAAMRRYASGAADPSRTAWLTPWATALSLQGLGLTELIPAVLYAGARDVAPGEAGELARVYTELGIYLDRQGAGEAAAASYARAVALDSLRTEARVNLAWHRYLEGRLEEAIALDRQVLAAGDHEVALLNLALAELAAGRVDTAEAIYARAVRTFGAEAARRLGADDDLRDLARRGVQTAAVRRILARHWPPP